MSDEETQEPLGLRSIVVDAELQVRDAAKREIDVRVMPWNTPIDTVDGVEEFRSGAFDGADLSRVFLMGVEHEVHLGVDQSGKVVPVRRPQGKVVAVDNRDDGQHATVRVAKTGAGDDILALAEMLGGVSVEFNEVPGGTDTTRVGGRRRRVHHRVNWTGLSITHRPAYADAAVLAVRSQEVKKVEDTQEVPTVDVNAPVLAAIEQMRAEQRSIIVPGKDYDAQLSAIIERLDKQDEQARAQFEVPSNGGKNETNFRIGDWASLVLRMFAGEKVSQREIEVRIAADLITSDNLGVVPEAWLTELRIGIIDPARPFLNSTTEVRAPAAGMVINVPKIVTRPTVGIQDPEKEELTSTPTSITSENYSFVSIGGYGDISLQLLKRSDPSYLELYVNLLAEALAAKADDLAVDALLAETAVVEGGAIDPDDGPLFGDAWANAGAVSRLLRPDTIWMSSSAVAAFINAKSDTTNAPLYGNLAGAFSAATGEGGTISGLRPIHVPALDDESVDIIVGPRRGFAWAEDGSYQLQVDVPAKAGRDVALISMLAFMPLYPGAFTSYTVAS